MTTKAETLATPSAVTDPTVEKYMEKPYTLVLKRDPENDVWVARVTELAGCTAHGETRAEALVRLEATQRRWIAAAVRVGKAIPEPSASEEEREFSGRWVQRVPKYLHAELVSVAKHEETSLNSLCETFLARAVGEYRASIACPQALLGVAALRRATYPTAMRSGKWFIEEPLQKKGLYRLKVFAQALTQRIPTVDDEIWPMEGHVNELIAHIRS